MQLRNCQKPQEEIAHNLLSSLLYVAGILASCMLVSLVTVHSSFPLPSPGRLLQVLGWCFLLSLYVLWCEADIFPKGKGSCKWMALLNAFFFFVILAPQIPDCLGCFLKPSGIFFKFFDFEIILDSEKLQN